VVLKKAQRKLIKQAQAAKELEVTVRQVQRLLRGLARGEIDSDAIEATRQALLEYCKLDTFAMVRLHETLFQLGTGTSRAGGG
jgi:transcriptional regulator NrdR family protein